MEIFTTGTITAALYRVYENPVSLKCVFRSKDEALLPTFNKMFKIVFHRSFPLPILKDAPT